MLIHDIALSVALVFFEEQSNAAMLRPVQVGACLQASAWLNDGLVSVGGARCFEGGALSAV